jgi:hypothetical protein
MAIVPINEKALTKGELRKFTALRRSIGEDLAERVFAEWLRKKPDRLLAGRAHDRNAERIVATLLPMIERKQLTIRRGGYLIRRGRGRVIVEPNRSG